MHQRQSHIFNRRSARAIFYVLILAGILAILFPGSNPAFADSTPGGNVTDPTIRAVDIAQPAVVRIITAVNGQLKVQFSATNNVTFPQATNSNYEIDLSGTGTFITSQGDILTADHVVSPPQQDLTTALYNQAAQNIADYMNQHNLNGGTQITKDQVVQQLTSGQLKSTSNYQKPGSSVFLSTAYTSKTNAQDFKSLPTGIGINVDSIKKESPPNQEDTAIIHVPLTDTLSAPISSTANVNSQDKLTIIGFPGDADISQAPDGLLTPSLNQIYVSSLKTSSTGAPLIQVGGNVGHGDSGGPALDNQGNIVGIVSFGTTNSAGGLDGTSFLQASSSAQTMIQSLKLNTAPGTQEKLWSQAFNEYAASTTGHWQSAQQDFAKLLKNYPLFKATQPLEAYAQTQAKTSGAAITIATPTPAASHTTPAKGTAATPFSWQAMAATIAAIAVVVLLAIVLFGMALRQKRKPGKILGKKKASTNSRNATAAQPDILPGAQSNPPSIPAANGVNPPVNVSGVTPGVGQETLALKVWPCGHMNRPNARFCSICGELAPTQS
ncbi:trypsin-like peptidase domain-containing protein [Dictyobacter arantiisoli]|uniref:Peptidase S1 domain-containing protein n=1 Tax=Dictyobacter arantiisoli TaxID=2014874 RepID=A0A5A5T5Q5_9CHLR|nr:trypsin-like peptidase domain-containing protein [Dictyobacter arantiisoli]GCF06677.1 hypothetical protein KDI_02410 [Dictyobacter arantiisoli]